MADVLDQSEVDALLAAVEQDDSGGPTSATASTPVFSHRRGGMIDDDVEIRPYDFKRPERVSKDQMRALETLHEQFSRNFGAALSGFLRTIMEVKVASIEQMTFSEFTHSLPNPTCFNLLSPDPLEGNMCLEISPLIIYPVIDRLLGGSNADLFIPQRPLTAIELRLVHQILNRAMRSLEESWANIIPLHFKLEETESNPALVQIVAPNEVVVVVGFELKMGGRAGTMSLAIPYNVIEPVIEKLSNQTWAAYKRTRRDGRLRHRLAGHLEAAKLEVTAVLANTSIKVSELMSLQPGDIILTEKPASAPLTLMVEGRRKHIGHLGQFRGNRAFKVSRAIQFRDRV
jgi:flagellar motor switch protein FliM